MSFRESFYSTKQKLVNRMKDMGLTDVNMDMGWTSIIEHYLTTTISIDVPLVLEYDVSFLITGTLETSNHARLTNKTVKLKIGDTVVGSTLTNNDGEFSFTQTPVQHGNHSFQVIFEGDNIYGSSASSIVTRNVDGMTTSVINLNTLPTQHYGNSVVLGGTLSDSNGEPISQAVIKYYEDNSYIESLTTDEYGRFQKTKVISSFNTVGLLFEFEGSSNYVSSSATQNLTVYQKDLRLTSDKDILSYADNESAILTAQVIDSSGENLGIGNEKITFESSSLYDSLMQDNNQFDVPTGTTIGFGEHGLIINDDNAWYKGLTLDLCNNSYTLTMDCYSESNTHVIGYLKSKNGTSTQFQVKNNLINVTMDSVYDVPISSSNITVKVELTPTSQKLYIDNNLIVESDLDFTAESSYEECKFGFINYNSNEYCVSNLNIEGDIKVVKETNSNGNVSFEYVSKGVGDISIGASATFDGTFVSKTYGIEDCKKVFKLDGTEPTGTFGRGSITCSNGILSGKSGYVKGFDNTDSWVLSFDVYHISYCLLPLVPTTTTTYDNNYIQLMGYVRIYENGRYRDIPYDSGASKKYNEWQNIKIEKENRQYTLYFDDVFVATFTLSWNPSQLGVGFDAWSGSNSGQIKNIKVKPL